jgi:hypothetical protein
LRRRPPIELEGASIFLSGRNAAPVDAVANDIVASGGVAEAANVDALKRKMLLRQEGEKR